MKKKIIYGVILLLVVFVAYFVFFADEENDVDSFVVESGTVSEEIFETGSVRKGESANIGFKEGGRVASIYVSENEELKEGDMIAELDKTSLQIELREARDAKRSAEVALEKLLSGASEEEVSLVRSAVSSAEDVLESAKTSLRDAKRSAEESLSDVYSGIPSKVSSSVILLETTKEDSQDFISNFFRGFITSETLKARKGRDKVYNAFFNVEDYRGMTRGEFSFSEKDKALQEIRQNLRLALSGVEEMISAAKSDFYEDRIPDAQVDAMRELERKLIADLSEVTSLIRSTESVRVKTEAEVNSARSAVSSAEKKLESAQRELETVVADPSSEDIETAEIAIRRAESKIELIEDRIENYTLKAPFSGRVSEIMAKRGEVVSAGTPFVSLVSEDRYYVESHIYEGDIVNIDIGDPVEVEFVPFPGEVYKGEVSFINETGRVIDGVVYYKIEVSMDDLPERVMTEMSVDLTVISSVKEDVLLVPDRYLKRRDGKRIANVVVDGKKEERVLETGIRGSDGMIEVISGLSKGDVIYE